MYDNPLYLWLKVTADDYEFPLIIADSASELARKAGVTKNAIYTSVWHAEHRNYKSIYRKLPVRSKCRNSKENR